MDGIIESTVNAEPVANVEPQVEVNETSLENAQSSESVNTEVAPVENKQVQSAEENAKFAEVRRKAAEEAKVKAKDEMISEMYGASHGIHTYAEYQAAMAKQEQEQKLSELLAQNIPEEYAKEMLESRKFREQFEAEQKAKQQQEQQQADMKDFINAFPGVKADEIPVEVWQANARGIPLRYAYAEHAYKQTMKAEEIAKANAENAKSSTGSVNGDGVANDSDFISYDDFEKQKSNQSWLVKNYNKIMNSRAKW